MPSYPTGNSYPGWTIHTPYQTSDTYPGWIVHPPGIPLTYVLSRVEAAKVPDSGLVDFYSELITVHDTEGTITIDNFDDNAYVAVG